METKTKNTLIASATAAAVLATGVGIYSTTNNSEIINEEEPRIENVSEIDWSLYDLNIPTLNLPVLNLPVLDIFSVDNVTKIDVTPSKIEELNKKVSSNIINFKDEKYNASTDKYDGDFEEWVEFIKENKPLFKDERTIDYDKSFTKDNPIYKEWIKIYNDYKDAAPVSYVPIAKKFKMITEVRPIKFTYQISTLDKNLTYYKAEGYDSVLVAFTKDDAASNVLNTVLYIKQNFNMDVWLTYTGDEKLNLSPFMNVTEYTNILKACAPYLSGYVNSWRRTSVHIFEQDDQFMSYTNHTLRSVNPNLPIIGELYYGNTHKYDTIESYGFGMNNFKNSSGIMIVNFGFRRIDFKYLFNTVLKPYIKDMPKIGCVVGHRPYYMTRYNNNLTYQENMEIKHEIENKFFEYGCIGTITLANDGREAETNDLSTVLYTKLQGKN